MSTCNSGRGKTQFDSKKPASTVSQSTLEYFGKLNDIVYTPLTVDEIKTKVESMYRDIINASDVTITQTYGGLAGGTVATGFPSVPSADDQKSLIQSNLYNAKVKIFCDELLDEYCLCFNVYKAALTALLTNIVNKSSGTTSITDQNITDMTDITGQLNTKCQNMLIIMNKVSQELQRRTGEFQTTITSLNSTIDSNVNIIRNYNTALNSKDIESDVTKRMAEYTYEKNKYSSNLLALYGGLNIVALALLVYIYRS